jgi:Putative Ig domain/Galactose oxidase, central domain
MKRSLLLLFFVCSLCVLHAGGCGSSTPPPPVITVDLVPNASQALDVNQSVSLTANVGNDSSNQGVNWTVTCPAGVTTCGAMAQTKSASGFPNKYNSPANVSAAEMVTVTATSVSDPNQFKSVQVTVNPSFALVNPPPAQPQPGNVGQPFSLSLASFVQGGTPPFTWSIKSGTLPVGLTLSASTGMVTGIPSATASAAAVSFNCIDSGIPPISTPASIQISLAINPGILAITSGAPPGGTLRTQYDGSSTGFRLTGSGGVAPYTWTWAAAAGSSLPPGLNFSPSADNTATIGGVPTTAGSYNVAVTMKDAESPAAAPASANYTIAVNAPPPLTISSPAPPTGNVGAQYYPHLVRVCVRWVPYPPPGHCGQWQYQTRYGFPLAATGGVGAHTWTWVAVAPSSLPPGLSLAANGTISGIPPILSTTAGSYTVSITATDSGIPQVQTSKSYTVIINNPSPPVINTAPAPPAGAVNLPYSFTFTATQGLPSLTLTWSETGALPAGLSFSNAGVLSGTPTASGSIPITIHVQDSLLQNASPQNFTIQVFAHGFKTTGSMANARASHTATLLSNGKVLVAGGTDANGNPVATAELYDPTTGSFSPTGSMATARAHFAATLLCNLSSPPCNDNRVLVTGGLDTNGNPLTTAELYDPTAGTFSPTSGSMQFVHASHTATLLNNGKVLVAGWGNATAELFDPATRTFAATGSMAAARVSHTATLLNNGKVLVTGGIGGVMTVLAEAELYDPTTGSFSTTLGSMATARQWHTASLLAGGKVLVTGGLVDNSGTATATAEVFDPTTQLFTATKANMGTARAFQTATVLGDGTVLVTGGDPPGAVVLATAELYNPNSQIFTPTGSMGTARTSHTATLLNDGRVLITGGTNGVVLATAELYQ